MRTTTPAINLNPWAGISLSFALIALAYCGFTAWFIHFNFFHFNFQDWKRFDWVRSAIFWFIPVAAATLAYHFTPLSHRSTRQVYRMLALIWISQLLLDLLLYFSFALNPVELPRLQDLALPVGGLAIIYIGSPLLAYRLLDYNLKSFGLPLAGIRQSALRFLIVCPVLFLITFLASSNEAFLGVYPFYRQPTMDLHELGLFMVWELMYGVVLFSVEFFFRGVFLHALNRHMGYTAVLVMMLFYVMVHFSKPLPECIAAMFGALALGVYSLRTGNIWFGFFCHLAVAWSMDFWAISKLF